ncbi:MAG: cell division protein FtsW, partial [Pedosphaera parvula]|nr:cell division protein FtsW [Pedosphaera parvula]
GASLALLLLVLLVGEKINGARRWLALGPARFQPSELAKLALILVLAWYGERYQRQMPALWKGFVRPLALVGLVVTLIFLEPDWGTALLIGAVSMIMLLVAGIRWRYVFPVLLAGGLALNYAIAHNSVRHDRVTAFLDLEKHKEGVRYQPWQAMLAFGAGGWLGKGLGNSRQKLDFIPEHHTDFILSVVGEELGAAATLSVLLAFVVLVVCGVFIAWHARDMFGQLLATGITFLIGLQAFINIGVETSTLPNKGISLPFISYGGSNLLVMLVCVGILFSVARGASEEEPAESVPGQDEELLAPQLS